MQSGQKEANIEELVSGLVKQAESYLKDNQRLTDTQEKLITNITEARKQLTALRQSAKQIRLAARLCNRKFEYQQQAIDCFFYQAQWSFLESFNSSDILKLFKHLVSLAFKNFFRDWNYLIDNPEKLKEIKLNDFKEYFSQLTQKYVNVISNGSIKLTEYESKFNLLMHNMERQTHSSSVTYQSEQISVAEEKKDFNNITIETFLKELVESTEKHIKTNDRLKSQNKTLEETLKRLLTQCKTLSQKEGEIRKKLEKVEIKFKEQQSMLLKQIIKDSKDIEEFQNWFSTLTLFYENDTPSFVERLNNIQNGLKNKLNQPSPNFLFLSEFKVLQNELYNLANELITNLLRELIIDKEPQKLQNPPSTILKKLLTPSIVWPIIEQLITCSNKSSSHRSSLYNSIRNNDTSQLYTIYNHFLQEGNNNETENKVITHEI